MPLFSIIVPTKNRPELLRRALESLSQQVFVDFEVLIVDDGSSPEYLEKNKQLVNEFDERFLLLSRGTLEGLKFGPSAARNFGAANAKGSILGFLDDDDYWVDNEHLLIASKHMESDVAPDLYLANQIAIRDGEVVVEKWQAHLFDIVPNRPLLPESDLYGVNCEDLVQPGGIGFGHVNISLVKKSLFHGVGGFCEALSYEEDLNFYLRVIDLGQSFVFRPHTVSVNTVRSSGRGASSFTDEEKGLLRILACQHAQLNCQNRVVLDYIRLLHSGALKDLSKNAYHSKRYVAARDYAQKAYNVQPSLKWKFIHWFSAVRAVFASA